MSSEAAEIWKKYKNRYSNKSFDEIHKTKKDKNLLDSMKKLEQGLCLNSKATFLGMF